MPQSRAEIQRRYREKKKNESGAFMKRERERKRKAYVPVTELTESDLKQRRSKTLSRVKKYYAKKKKIIQMIRQTDGQGPNTRSKQNENTILKVALSFKKRNSINEGKQRVKLRQAHETIHKLKQERELMLKERKKLNKRIERLRRNQEIQPNSDDNEPKLLTPRSKTKIQMKLLKISHRKERNIHKQLLFGNVLQEELKNSLSGKKKKNARILSMKIVKKYRLMKSVGKMLNMDERTLKGKKRVSKMVQEKKKLLKAKVKAFLEREDNATMMPGKQDAVGKDKSQKMVLNDYMHNLYSKFRLENPETKLSRSRFCQMRPQHVLLANFCNRATCLCFRHQNMALKLRALHSLLPGISRNPDTFIVNNYQTLREDLEKLNVENVVFTEWKKVDDRGKQRWKQVQSQLEKSVFIEQFQKTAEEFASHVDRVKIQYGEMRRLRQDLPDGHVLVWMDFAENFTCTALEEVQSAYWTSDQVTLHTSVMYFPTSHEKTHISIVGISDVLAHNPSMVYAMLQKMVPMIKQEYPALKHIHYLTDSPSSQYRNKTIFQLLTGHTEEFGVPAQWDYLESGHGKGPCDGLGGSVKRSADMAVKRGKCVIQSAHDFFAWTMSPENKSDIHYYFVAQEDYDGAVEKIKSKSQGLKPIPGTMKVHAVIPISTSCVAVRDTSCNCSDCLNDVCSSKCDGWRYYDLQTGHPTNNKPDSMADTNNVVHAFIVGTYASAIYDGKWYIGIISAVDDNDQEIQVNFMQQTGKIANRFKWPTTKDELWVPFSDILTTVPDPQPSGKTKRMYEVNANVLQSIEAIFARRNDD